jgi:hypothetical protein
MPAYSQEIENDEKEVMTPQKIENRVMYRYAICLVFLFY